MQDCRLQSSRASARHFHLVNLGLKLAAAVPQVVRVSLLHIYGWKPKRFNYTYWDQRSVVYVQIEIYIMSDCFTASAHSVLYESGRSVTIISSICADTDKWS
jgi:hypothetical protein